MKTQRIDGAERGCVFITEGDDGDISFCVDSGHGEVTHVKFNYIQAQLIQNTLQIFNYNYVKSRSQRK